MKIIKLFFAGVLCFFALVFFIGAMQHADAPRPSQVPAKENMGNIKLPAPTVQELVILRKAYAEEFDRNMIEHRIESTTKAIGPRATTLEITCALTSRVMAHDVSKNLDWNRLKELGFRKVHLTNGFESELREGYSWDVAKNAD